MGILENILGNAENKKVEDKNKVENVVENIEKKKRGRPAGKTKKQIPVYIKTTLVEELTKFYKQKNISRSKFIEDAIEFYLKYKDTIKEEKQPTEEVVRNG